MSSHQRYRITSQSASRIHITSKMEKEEEKKEEGEEESSTTSSSPSSASSSVTPPSSAASSSSPATDGNSSSSAMNDNSSISVYFVVPASSVLVTNKPFSLEFRVGLKLKQEEKKQQEVDIAVSTATDAALAVRLAAQPLRPRTRSSESAILTASAPVVVGPPALPTVYLNYRIAIKISSAMIEKKTNQYTHTTKVWIRPATDEEEEKEKEVEKKAVEVEAEEEEGEEEKCETKIAEGSEELRDRSIGLATILIKSPSSKWRSRFSLPSALDTSTLHAQLSPVKSGESAGLLIHVLTKGGTNVLRPRQRYVLLQSGFGYSLSFPALPSSSHYSYDMSSISCQIRDWKYHSAPIPLQRSGNELEFIEVEDRRGSGTGSGMELFEVPKSKKSKYSTRSKKEVKGKVVKPEAAKTAHSNASSLLITSSSDSSSASNRQRVRPSFGDSAAPSLDIMSSSLGSSASSKSLQQREERDKRGLKRRRSELDQLEAKSNEPPPLLRSDSIMSMNSDKSSSSAKKRQRPSLSFRESIPTRYGRSLSLLIDATEDETEKKQNLFPLKQPSTKPPMHSSAISSASILPSKFGSTLMNSTTSDLFCLPSPSQPLSSSASILAIPTSKTGPASPTELDVCAIMMASAASPRITRASEQRKAAGRQKSTGSKSQVNLSTTAALALSKSPRAVQAAQTRRSGSRAGSAERMPLSITPTVASLTPTCGYGKKKSPASKRPPLRPRVTASSLTTTPFTAISSQEYKYEETKMVDVEESKQSILSTQEDEDELMSSNSSSSSGGSSSPLRAASTSSSATSASLPLPLTSTSWMPSYQPMSNLGYGVPSRYSMLMHRGGGVGVLSQSIPRSSMRAPLCVSSPFTSYSPVIAMRDAASLPPRMNSPHVLPYASSMQTSSYVSSLPPTHPPPVPSVSDMLIVSPRQTFGQLTVSPKIGSSESSRMMDAVPTISAPTTPSIGAVTMFVPSISYPQYNSGCNSFGGDSRSSPSFFTSQQQSYMQATSAVMVAPLMTSSASTPSPCNFLSLPSSQDSRSTNASPSMPRGAPTIAIAIPANQKHSPFTIAANVSY